MVLARPDAVFAPARNRCHVSLPVNAMSLKMKVCNHVIMRHHHMHGRRYGRPGGWQQAQQPDASGAAEWFAGRLPEDWFDGDPTVIVDREEITVIGKLPGLESPEEESAARASGRVSRFRDETRPERMTIADEAQNRYGRKVSWGVEVGGERILFTHIAVSVMTRLKQPERQVLDTLVDAGVARSRSDALAWSVKLVGEHTEEWLAKLRTAMSAVDDLRAQGPDLPA
ncbi:transcriptional regulator AbmR [Mycobacterium tuberculosis]|uniref:transcriptional regulator AbmR n=1 Tax=Mycobacterium tuberculosis TaxID=1773 RepID=UPI00099AD532|nr:transcriptional regulator AbmR [Mycobacterium tuberculosis]